MAIAPNNTFVAGDVLTAAECNAFPFGVVALTTKTTTNAITTTETNFMAATFTAIANRYYRITYFAANSGNTNASGDDNITFIIRNGSTTGATQLTQGACNIIAGKNIGPNTVVAVSTFTAGSQTIGQFAKTTSGTATTSASATSPQILLVEDIGPA
jgi:hypothetical protein